MANSKNILVKPSRKKGVKAAKIHLKEELTIYTVEEIFAGLEEAFNKFDELEIILEKVDNLDLSFLQLLVSLKSSAGNEDKKVSVKASLSEEHQLLISRADLLKILDTNRMN